jgi:hypothetical protein
MKNKIKSALVAGLVTGLVAVALLYIVPRLLHTYGKYTLDNELYEHRDMLQSAISEANYTDAETKINDLKKLQSINKSIARWERFAEPVSPMKTSILFGVFILFAFIGFGVGVDNKH